MCTNNLNCNCSSCNCSTCNCSNDACGCKTSTNEVVYQGPPLTCSGINNCDSMTTVLQHLNDYICSSELVHVIINNIFNNQNLYQQFTTIVNQSVDCETVWGCQTTTTTTTTNACEAFSLTNTGVDPVAIIITDCVTQIPEAIVLMPGDTNICVVTDSPLTVPGTVLVTPNGPCGTTTTTSTSSSTTTTTTTLPCECLTFNNTDVDSHIINYVNCLGFASGPIEILSHEVLQFCGCCGEASDPFVTITIGANCIDDACPTTTTTSSSSSTTTSTTTICQDCIDHDVTIGSQIWSGCNLDVSHYRNGDPIPQVTDPAVWASLTTGAWCYYNNDSANGPTYGKLYNWYAVIDPRGLAPVGYHIPTKTEIETLQTYLGGAGVAGGEVKQAGFCHWQSPNTGATDSSGFSSLPGGNRSITGVYQSLTTVGRFWTITQYEIPGGGSYAYTTEYTSSVLGIGNYLPIVGKSVRLIKGEEPIPTTTTTSTTCGPATSHPWPGTVVNGTDTIPDSGSFLVDACDAAACLQNSSCTTTSSYVVFWDAQYPGIGDTAYANPTGCDLGLAGLDGYFQINYDGLWIVAQIVNSVIVDFPSCTTTTTTTAAALCGNFSFQGLTGGGSWTGLDCHTGASVGASIAEGDTQFTGCILTSSLSYTNLVTKGAADC